jgi:radical SAM superfamily enzyme YgiQ (UPF0313 family)
MVGIPGESLNNLQQTIKLNDDLQTDFVRISVYTPFPGTPLANRVLNAFDSTSYFNNLDGLSPELKKATQDWISTLKNKDRLWNDE